MLRFAINQLVDYLGLLAAERDKDDVLDSQIVFSPIVTALSGTFSRPPNSSAFICFCFIR